jgi:hypothetical protein
MIDVSLSIPEPANDCAGSMDILIPRQLEVIDTGNGAYLETFLRNAKRAHLSVRLVFAPLQAFGNRPWSSIHPRFTDLVDEVVWPGGVKIGKRYWTASPTVWRRFAVRLWREALNRLGAKIVIPSYLGRPMLPREYRRIAAEVNAAPRDITIAEYSSTGPTFEHVTAPTIRGVLMHDLLSDRGPRFVEKGLKPDLYLVTPEEEAEWCQRSDVMIYASANELERFNPKINGADPVWLRPEPPAYGDAPLEGSNSPARVVFLGTIHAGNTDALRHWLDEIWPLVLEKKPELEFWIAGSVGRTISAEQAALPGVKVLGRVDNLEDIGGSESIGIAPTRLATGVSIKVVEYLMLQMSCVAYPVALEGFGDRLDTLVEIGETPEEFANEVVKLVDDRARRVAFAKTGKKDTARILSNAEVVSFLRRHARISA